MVTWTMQQWRWRELFTLQNYLGKNINNLLMNLMGQGMREMGSVAVEFISNMPPGYFECHLYIMDQEIKTCIWKILLHISKSSHFCFSKEALCLMFILAQVEILFLTFQKSCVKQFAQILKPYEYII